MYKYHVLFALIRKLIYLWTNALMVLGQLPPRKIAPRNSKTNPDPNTLTLSLGQLSSGAIFWLHPNPKTNPNLDPNPNPNRGAIVRVPNVTYVIFFLKKRYNRYQSFFCNF